MVQTLDQGVHSALDWYSNNLPASGISGSYFQKCRASRAAHGDFQIAFGFLTEPYAIFHCDKNGMADCVLLPVFPILPVDTFPLAQ